MLVYTDAPARSLPNEPLYIMYAGGAILVFFIVNIHYASPRPEKYGASPALSCVAFALQVAAAIIMNLDILMNQVKLLKKQSCLQTLFAK